MTDLPPAPPVQDPPPRVSDEFRSLRRSRSDRVVAGVLGGLGRRMGIDPVVLRVATVVLAIFGGVGVLLYAVAWLLVPAEGEEGSVLDQALGRGQERRSGAVPLACALALVGLITATGVMAGSWDSAVLLLLAGAGVFVLLRRRSEEEVRAVHEQAGPEQAWFEAPRGPWDDAGDVAPAAGGYPSTSGLSSTSGLPRSADAPSGAGPSAGPPSSDVPSPGWPEGPDWGVRDNYPAQPPAEPASPPAVKPKSVLGPVTFCTALVAVGVLAVNDAYWATVPAAMYVAVPLAIVALGLLIGTWYGRSRGLIVLGILLSMALIPATWLSQSEFDDVGDNTYRITRADQISAAPISHGAGSIHYDLSGLTLADGESLPLTIEQGAGELTITLPDDLDVVVNAEIGGGGADILGESRDGIGQSVTNLVDKGYDGPGGGELVLDVELGFGDLEVTR